MSSIALPATRQRRGLLPAPVRHAAPWVLAAAVSIALISIAMPHIGAAGSAPTSMAGDKGFTDGRFPVASIERAPTPKSGNRLVRVRCGGAAAKTSTCWISRAQPAGRHS